MIVDAKFSISVDGKQIHNGAPVEVDITEDEIIIETEIGKEKKQVLKIVITDMNYVEPIIESTDEKKVDE